jgi:EmrB/QacA subfamily drug resistance transporter
LLNLRGFFWKVGGGRRKALAVLLLAAFLLSLQDTAASVALPTIGRDLGLGPGGLEWVVNAYTVALAVLVLPAGRLADRVGRRRLFVVGLVVFGVASLAAGLASSAAELLVARVVQGAGAGLMGPASLALIAAAGGKSRASAIGAWAGAAAAGLALGPLVGAILTEQLGWSWIFLIDVPLVVVALAVVPGAIPRDEPGNLDRRSLDVGGIVLSALALAAGIFALTDGGFYGWTSPSVLAAGVLTLVTTAAFIAVERRQSEPLVQLGLFRSRAFSGANVVTLLSTAVMCSVLFFMSLYLQLAQGYSPMRAGVAFLPMTGAIVVAAPLAGALADRVGPRVPAVGGMLALALGLISLAQLGIGGSSAALLASLAMIGVGAGLTTTPVTAAALNGLPSERSGEAAGIVTTFRMIGLAVGISGMGALVALRWPGGLATAGLPAAGLGDGLADAFTVNAVLALTTAALAYFTLGRARTGSSTADEPERPVARAADVAATG